MKRLLLCACFVLWPIVAHAEPKLTLRSIAKVSKNDRAAYDWAIEPWRPSTLTLKLQKQVDTDFKKTKNHAAVVEQLRVKAFKTSMSFSDQFVWAYAAYKLEGERRFAKWGDLSFDLRSRLNLISALNVPPELNRTKEYARLQFLSNMRSSPSMGLIWRNLAIRLVQAYPKDSEIKWFAFQSLDPFYVAEDKPIYLAWMSEFERKYPKDSRVSEMRAGYYGGLYGKTLMGKDKAIMEKARLRALAEWQRCYRSAKTEQQRDSARREIKFLQMEKAFIEKRTAKS